MSSTNPAETDRIGAWNFPAISYVEPLRISCALCGRPIARRHWRETINGREMIFCEPAHASLYESYWLPTYGESPGGGSDVPV